MFVDVVVLSLARNKISKVLYQNRKFQMTGMFRSRVLAYTGPPHLGIKVIFFANLHTCSIRITTQ